MRNQVKKIVFIILLSLLVLLPLYSVSEGIYSLVNQKESPFSSVAYFSRSYDSYSNPAALPLIVNPSSLDISLYYQDKFDGDVFRLEEMGYLQNCIGEMRIAFLSKYISLSALFGTTFTDRHFEGGSINPTFDIYSNIDISIDASYAFPYFSFGINIRGGNSMVRNSKTLRNFGEIFSNAWFSPFDSALNSERFGLGFGILMYLDNFSLGGYVSEILNLKDEKIHASWEDIGNSSTISFAGNGNRFNKKGDLNLVNFRANYTLSGFKNKPEVNKLKVAFELIFQFLPEADLSFGVSYSELNHRFFLFDYHNGSLATYLRAEYNSFALQLGVNVDTGTWNYIAPSIVMSFSN